VHVSSPNTKSLCPVSLPATQLTSLISSDNRALSCKDGVAYADSYKQPDGYKQLVEKVMSGKGTDKDNIDLEKMADQVIPISICAKCGCRKDEHTTGAMTSLNLSKNRLGAEGAKIIAAVLPECT
jgi:hypothetical protein